MTQQELTTFYLSLDTAAKSRFLLLVSHNLTIAIRDLYDFGGESSSKPKGLIGANELQHHLSSEARHLHENDEKRYPDDVLMSILFEKATHYEILPQLIFGLQQAARYAVRLN